MIYTFLEALRLGDVERLTAVLDPDVVLRADGGGLAGEFQVVRGARGVAEQAVTVSKIGLSTRIVLVDGNVGLVTHRLDGQRFSMLGFPIFCGKIVEIDIRTDPERLERLDLSAVEGCGGLETQLL